ncbi:MAG: hypothetical protein GF372_08290, partial [Candidatus Marinimicrobia bacterium]|nr:hypothetical protein [Candidatus Neomarinimicrobiota bacterium]
LWNFSTLPFWFIEGTAEYYTEKWRIGRSDTRLKAAIYYNRIHRLAPHDEGFAKVLYLAENFGDSTLTEIIQWRHPTWKTYSFRQAFREATGMSPAAFHEQWRKAMNTYYYSYRGQKESLDDAGEIINVPSIGSIYSISISPDSSMAAYVSREPGARYHSIFIEKIESGEIRKMHVGNIRSRLQWSPDGRTIVFGEYRRGKYGSLIHDIRLLNVEEKRVRWLTENYRANYPVFSDQNELFYVKNLGRAAQIVRHNLATNASEQITHFGPETHLKYLDVSPDKRSLAFMIEDSSGHPDISIIGTDGSGFRKITDDPFEDLYPIWFADGTGIFFTSYRTGAANIFAVRLDSTHRLRQLTDVYTGLYTSQIMPQSKRLLADAISDADSSQFVLIDPERTVGADTLVIRDEYQSWRSRSPETNISSGGGSILSPAQTTAERYKFYKHPRHLGSLTLPTPTGISGFTAWTDPLGKHTAILGGELNYQPFSEQIFNGVYGIIHVASLKPFLTFGLVKNTSHLLGQYNGGLLHEKRDGIFALATYPMHSRNSLYRHHWVQARASLLERKAALRFSDESIRPAPESGSEGRLSLRYYYLSRLPETVNNFLPEQGGGFSIEIDVSESELFGEYSYTRQKIQAFKNQKITGKFTAHAQFLAENIHGHYPVQDMPGFYSDISFYPGGYTPFMLGPYSVLDTEDSYMLRGAETTLTGETLLQGTIELRVSLARNLPVKFFILSLGGMSFSPYLDAGVVHSHNQNSTLSTAGIELRNEVQIGNFSAVHFAYGLGQSLKSWRSSGKPGWFIRFGLINPF